MKTQFNGSWNDMSHIGQFYVDFLILYIQGKQISKITIHKIHEWAVTTDIGWSDLFSCHKISGTQINNVKKKEVNAFF